MSIQALEASWDEWDTVVAQMDRGSAPPQIVRGERRCTLSLDVSEAKSILEGLKSDERHSCASIVALLEEKIREHRGHH